MSQDIPGKWAAIWTPVASRLRVAFDTLLGRRRYDPARHYMRGPGPATQRRSDCLGQE